MADEFFSRTPGLGTPSPAKRGAKGIVLTVMLVVPILTLVARGPVPAPFGAKITEEGP